MPTQTKPTAYITFAERLPVIGQDIEVTFSDDPARVVPIGIIRRIRHVKELTGDECIYAEKSLGADAWTMDGSESVGAVVRPEYLWRERIGKEKPNVQ